MPDNDTITTQNQPERTPTAAMLIIGNEILSGRTQDVNLNYLAKHLTMLGIRIMEARVVPDIESEIIDAVNATRKKYDYVFTSGGIGPTHDDITAAAIAKAFGLPFGRHAGAAQALHDYYGEDINDARLNMADMPEDAILIQNNVSGAPGFQVENVFVMAGVPKIMQDMVQNLLDRLERGREVFSASIRCDVPESRMSAELGQIEADHNDVEIGSYPYMKNNRYGVNVVLRGLEDEAVRNAAEDVRKIILALGGNITENS